MDYYDSLLENQFQSERVDKFVKYLLNSDLKPIDFTFSKEELDDAIQRLVREEEAINSKPANIIEDYADEFYEMKSLKENIIGEIQKFNNLSDKNDIDTILSIISNIQDNYDSRVKLPDEIEQTIEEIRQQYNYLLSLKLKERLAAKQEVINKQEEVRKQESIEREQRKQEDSRIQQERLTEIQSKLPIINEDINYLRGTIKDNDKMIQLLKERTYFYNKKSGITAEDMDRFNSFLSELDSMKSNYVVEKVELKTEPVVEVNTPITKEDINSLDEILKASEPFEKKFLKEKASQYDEKIESLLEGIKPYMHREDVSKEMAKVADRNNEANNLMASDNIGDYEKAVEIKKKLVDYLEKANNFIDERKRERENNKSKNDNVEYNDLPPMRNADGTYTMEYISHLTSVALSHSGKDMAQTVYNQLLDYNKGILGKNNSNKELDEMMNDVEKDNENVNDNHMQYGFAALIILGLCISISGILIMIFGMLN